MNKKLRNMKIITTTKTIRIIKSIKLCKYSNIKSIKIYPLN